MLPTSLPSHVGLAEKVHAGKRLDKGAHEICSKGATPVSRTTTQEYAVNGTTHVTRAHTKIRCERRDTRKGATRVKGATPVTRTVKQTHTRVCRKGATPITRTHKGHTNVRANSLMR